MSNIYEQIRCETCGGELKYSEDRKSAVCLNCGNEYHFKEEKSENLAMMLNLANKARLANDFDGAIQKYEAVIEENPTDAEAHWGLVLSTYGIEYVEDPRTHERIPTCRRTVKQSIIENKDYLAAIENAAPEQREVYEVRAKLIDKLQTKIKKQLESEEDYDVFISFKATDNNGYPTKDSVVARAIYDELEKRGIKTFFSEVTLKHRLGEDYEPIIYKALYSCKFFILVATSEENMNSAWVKNEWSRFRDRVVDEAMTKAGCAVFENLGLNELPPFLRGQGIPLEKYPNGGYEIVIADSLADRFGLSHKNQAAEELKKQIEEQKRSTQELEEKLKLVSSSQKTASGVSVASSLARAKQYAEDGEWDQAIKKCNEVLDTDVKISEAWLNLFFWTQHTTQKKGLPLQSTAQTIEGCKKVLADNKKIADSFQMKYFINAVQFADQGDKQRLNLYREQILQRISNIRSDILQQMISIGNNKLTQEKFTEAKQAYNKVLEINKKEGRAYLGNFLAELQAKSLENAVAKIEQTECTAFTQNHNLKKAFMFADDSLKHRLIGFRESVVKRLDELIDDCKVKENAIIQKNQRIILEEKNMQARLTGAEKACTKYARHADVVKIRYGNAFLTFVIALSLLGAAATLVLAIFAREFLFTYVPLFDSWFRVWVESNETGLGTLVGFLLSAIVMALVVGGVIFIAFSILRLITLILFTIPRKVRHGRNRAQLYNCRAAKEKFQSTINDLCKQKDYNQRILGGLNRNLAQYKQISDYIFEAISG